jgi:hypothetical protein
VHPSGVPLKDAALEVLNEVVMVRAIDGDYD